jgi:hypothetical protein
VLSSAVAAGPPVLEFKACVSDEHWRVMMKMVRADLLQLQPDMR